jgi:hypothetical protein
MTLRRWMLVVASIAATIGLIAPAAWVLFGDTNQLHYHVSVSRHGSLVLSHPNPFWPRYWCRLTGRRWDGDACCRDPNFRRVEPGYDESFTGDDLGAMQDRINRAISSGSRVITIPCTPATTDQPGR